MEDDTNESQKKISSDVDTNVDENGKAREDKDTSIEKDKLQAGGDGNTWENSKDQGIRKGNTTEECKYQKEKEKDKEVRYAKTSESQDHHVTEKESDFVRQSSKKKESDKSESIKNERESNFDSQKYDGKENDNSPQNSKCQEEEKDGCSDNHKCRKQVYSSSERTKCCDEVRRNHSESSKCRNGEKDGNFLNHQIQSKDIKPIPNSTEAQLKFLDSLGLRKYFPEKISVQTAMEKSSSRLKSLTDSPWYLLSKTSMLDHRGRDSVISQAVRNDLSSDRETGFASADILDDVFSELDMIDSSENRLSVPHPMDVLIAVFMCCSNFLRQMLCEKMFICKLSIPLLLPPCLEQKSMFLLWSLRNIVLKIKQPDGEFCDRQFVNHPTFVVSCLRLGEISRSKSKYLNEILNGQSHPTFYHRDCEGGTSRRTLSEGMIEVAWQLPIKDVEENVETHGDVKRKKPLFLKSEVALLNLRGDGISHEVSLRCIYEISDVALVMVDVCKLNSQDVLNTLRSILSNNIQLILMLTKQPNVNVRPETIKKDIKSCMEKVNFDSFQKDCIILDCIGSEEKNIKILKDEASMKISKCLERRPPRQNLASCQSLMKSLDIIVDENNPMCSAGKEKAVKMMQIINEDDRKNLRSSILPLQGKPWQEWSNLNREQHRRERKGKDDLVSYMDEIYRKKKEQRKEQVAIIRRQNKLFDTFSWDILSLRDEGRLYYFKWLKLLLDDFSREKLPGRENKCRLKWSETRQSKTEEELLSLQNELVKYEEELAESSFGLEHFIRELSQAYEAIVDIGEEISMEVREKVACYSKIMAELMLFGYPLELMDGDAGSVPFTWVKAVLDQLKELIGNRKIFVLSVLGIQSSGKSTLLNTMFGLQFAVSAGRCTRGVYAQLVPIPKEYSSLECDYIVVVDTEGLRAAELGGDKLRHDNEIATLAVGLGDVTLVNFKGENVAEMEDVLQIVIHALLKMKLVNKNLALQPSCFFVHQNVAASDASQKLRSGQQKFIETLDRVTKAAGNQEDMPQYTKFSHIIDFDITKNIFYFSDLWRGDPPMGHANPGYSESVNKVKQVLLTDIMPKHTSFLNIQKFSTKVQDLCNGILEQNFVFSFKNNLEIEAYSSLEEKLSDVLWGLKKKALTWQNDKENEIMSSEDGLQELNNSLVTECYHHLEEVYNSAKEKIEFIFRDDEDVSILEQWRSRTFRKLESCREDIINRTIHFLSSKIKVRQIQIDQKKDIEKYKSAIMEEAKKVAEDLKSRENAQILEEAELEELFDGRWKDWLKVLSHTYNEDINIENIANRVVYDIFHQDVAIVNKVLGSVQVLDENTIHDNFLLGVEEYISQKKRLWSRVFLGQPSDTQKVNDHLNRLYEEMNYIVQLIAALDFKTEIAHYPITKSQEIVKRIIDSGLSISDVKEFEIWIAICSCQYASNKCLEMFNSRHITSGKYAMGNFGIHPYFEEQLCRIFSSSLIQVQQKMSKISRTMDNHTFNCRRSIAIEDEIMDVEAILGKLEEDIKSFLGNPEIQEFREEYIEEILKMVIHVTSQTKYRKLGKEVKISIAIHMCSFALPSLTEKHSRYVDSLDPRKVLDQDYYCTYLQMFKNSYCTISDEIALSKVLSEHLSKAIENAVDKNMAAELADDVRNNVPEVKMKPALLKVILLKLIEEDDYHEFLLYLEKTSACFEKWIEHFIDIYLFSCRKDGSKRYTEIAFSNIARMISKVCEDIINPITDISENLNDGDILEQWLEEFQMRVKGKLTIQLQDLLSLTEEYSIVNLKSFTENFVISLQATESKLKALFDQHTNDNLRTLRSVLEDNVYGIISQECKGCTEKCPFCSAPCTLNTAGHIEQGDGIKHMANEHLPGACAKWRCLSTKKMVTENCTTQVASNATFQCPQTDWENHPYQRYQDIFPDWKIDGDPSVEASPYWKWFLVKYSSQLAKRYHAEKPDIPISWRWITKEQAKKSIRN